MSMQAGTESVSELDLPPVAAPGSAGRGPRLTGGRLVARAAPLAVPWLMLAALIAAYSSLQEGVLSREQLNLWTAATLTLLLVAAGQTIVILLGGIDLSVGGIVSLSTALAATQLGTGGSRLIGWAALIALLGFAAGAVNGFLVARLRLQPFIVTLATWSIWSGVALWVLPTEGGTVPESYLSWVNREALGIGAPVAVLLALVAFWIWFKRTPLGTGIRAIGSSENSAYLSGVPTSLTVTAAYALSGLFAALAGLFLVTQTASGSPTVGNDFILNSVAAVVIGGTSLFGGRGGLGGTIAGAFVLTVIGDLIFALDISSFWTPITTGVLLILAVLANSLTELYARRRARR
ncbi:MAG: ABC transporter permease [Actinobacteria bacterium]|nr:ABC transporter permease [Actinomycetota bacterium]